MAKNSFFRSGIFLALAVITLLVAGSYIASIPGERHNAEVKAFVEMAADKVSAGEVFDLQREGMPVISTIPPYGQTASLKLSFVLKDSRDCENTLYKLKDRFPERSVNGKPVTTTLSLVMACKGDEEKHVLLTL
jgi:hypothetical protein